MPTTSKTSLDRLASLGEEMLGKAAQNPAAHRLVQGAMQLKERVDDLSKRVRGLEQMEKRLETLEKRVAKLAGVVPTCSPSSSIGRCSAESTSTRAVRSTSTFGCPRCVPL